jgi:HlyD family secretion protein
MKRIVRFLTLLIFFGALAAGVLLFVQGQGQAGAQEQASDVIDEAVVVRDSLRVTISATGAVAPDRQVALLFELANPVTEIFVEEGQPVQAGDPLARVQATEFESALQDALILVSLRQIALDALLAPARDVDVTAAQAALDAAQAQLVAAYGADSPEQEAIARVQAELARNRLWQAQLQRDLAVNPPAVTITQDIPGGGSITETIQPPGADPEQFESGLEQAEFGIQVADARAQAAGSDSVNAGLVASAEAAIVAAQTALDRLVNGPSAIDIRMAQIDLEQAQRGADLAQANLDRATLRAPFAGVIASLNLTVGEPPSAQQPAIQLINTDAYYLDLALDETDIGRVELGQQVVFDLDALPGETITGVVTRTSIVPAPQVPGQQVVTYIVRVTLDPTTAPVRAGMTATASIIVSEVPDTLLLPNRFIRIDRDTDDAFVTIQTAPGEFEELPLSLGARNETTTEILAGLTEGQRVVLVPRAVFNPVGQPPAGQGGGPGGN